MCLEAANVGPPRVANSVAPNPLAVFDGPLRGEGKRGGREQRKRKARRGTEGTVENTPK